MAEIINITVEVKGEHYLQRVEGTHWSQDENGDRYVYNGDVDGSDEVVAEVSPEHFVSITKEVQ